VVRNKWAGKQAMATMEHVVLGDEVEDSSESSLQELANAALKSLSEFQIKVKRFSPGMLDLDFRSKS
jgi:hypothetical protein